MMQFDLRSLVWMLPTSQSSMAMFLIACFALQVNCCCASPTDNPELHSKLLEAVQFAKHVYEPKTFLAPQDYEQVSIVDHPTTGLYAEIFLLNSEQQRTKGAEIVVAIRGTDLSSLFKRPFEFTADLGAAAFGGAFQSLHLSRELQAVLRDVPDSKVTLVGHSLGGMVAQTTALSVRSHDAERPVQVITFNSPGIFRSEVAKHTGVPVEMGETIDWIHLLHIEDAVPHMTLFGSHHPMTHCIVIDDSSINKHSLNVFSNLLTTSNAQLLTPLSVNEVKQKHERNGQMRVLRNRSKSRTELQRETNSDSSVARHLTAEVLQSTLSE